MDNNTMWPLDMTAAAQHQIAGKTITEWLNVIHAESLNSLHIKDACWLSTQDAYKLVKNNHNEFKLIGLCGNIISGELSAESSITATSSFKITYPWDLLNIAEQVIGSLNSDNVLGDIHPRAVVEGAITLGQGSRLLPGVFIEGNVVIGENCKIGPNCYIRGNTSIGNNVHIGQSVEIKNSIIGNNSAVGHLSYVGDSILGDNVNFGAGTITSNFRHDGSNHKSMVNGNLHNTGRRKFGTIIGDGVHTGIHTSIYPGRKLGKTCTTLPGTVVQEDIHNQNR